MSVIGALPPDLFFVVMAIVSIGWLSLIFFPRHRWANYWLSAVVIPFILGVLYTALMVVYWFHPPEGDVEYFLTLIGAQTMFQNQGLLLAAWTDIILLSLVAGAWITRKAVQLQMPSALLIPVLLITFAFPGTGLVIFFVASWIKGQFRTLERLENAAPTG